MDVQALPDLYFFYAVMYGDIEIWLAHIRDFSYKEFFHQVRSCCKLLYDEFDEADGNMVIQAMCIRYGYIRPENNTARHKINLYKESIEKDLENGVPVLQIEDININKLSKIKNTEI